MPLGIRRQSVSQLFLILFLVVYTQLAHRLAENTANGPTGQSGHRHRIGARHWVVHWHWSSPAGALGLFAAPDYG